MINLSNYEVWFVTGSQHLYGEETLKQVDTHSKEIATYLNDQSTIPVKVVFKPVLTTPDVITKLCLEANNAPNCIGLVTWMHTFSPAKMWINGLKVLQKPFMHLHTQFNRDIPWGAIDMDFMNLNQSAHGGREFGFIGSRMRINRKVVVGHWQDPETIERIAVWTRVASAWADQQGAKFARIGDNMREVAVTEGDKVEAQIKLGYCVNGYGVGDVTKVIDAIPDAEVEELMGIYEESYIMANSLKKGGSQRGSLYNAAKIELGLKKFLIDGGFKGFTDTFENLYGMDQLPGIAVQRLMAQGFGFGGEGDWKTAALVRAMKVMAVGLPGGDSFMEDYTYHFHPGGQKVLGAHMLEICESIASSKPKCEVHPLSIGGKADPVRLVFDAPAGAAINASIIDMGNRFRVLVNTVDVVEPEQDLPNLPVARALWIPQPNLKVAASAWILAGGAHHTVFSQAITAEYLEDYAEMAGLEYVTIDSETRLHNFKNELNWNQMYYGLGKGI
ncbi:L-arabinose isomerase [Flammeovirgaceae bacterium SG7u.111]|nr:L-arabinose isomerase [Flammeovirgaceae bacterium SG7u.132]WPO37460.1 L-arabinose isomerase [Flammeovirgaceae bacterium SG7u.111]